MISKELRDAFIMVVSTLETYEVFMAKKHLTKHVTAKIDEVTLADEYLILGTEDHNYPL